MLTIASGQTPGVPILEQSAPAIPVDLATLTTEKTSIEAQADAKGSGSQSSDATASKTDDDGKPVPDYAAKIGNGLKERERRLTLLNEAMMKLREAGEMEDAGRVEERIRALLEMPAPSQAGSKMHTEIEQLRAKNDDLALQLLALQEELKRYRPANATAGNRKGVASADR